MKCKSCENSPAVQRGFCMTCLMVEMSLEEDSTLEPATSIVADGQSAETRTIASANTANTTK